MRERRRSIPALPYMERLMSFSLLIFPSTGPVLQGIVKAARTASTSRRIPRANEDIGPVVASCSHGFSAAISRLQIMDWKRRAKPAAVAMSGGLVSRSRQGWGLGGGLRKSRGSNFIGYGVTACGLKVSSGRDSDIRQPHIHFAVRFFDNGDSHLESIAVAFRVLFQMQAYTHWM
jgi:hypothetical protein